jgi:glycosyltransferase involved in cell wall biosynthesis
MKISYYTVEDNLDTTRGYGQAGFNVVRSLQQLGHEVPFDDPTAPVQIAFCPPQWYKFHPGQYKIGYTPWESTELPNGWVEKMNECDEVWATSPWVAQVYAMNGVTKPIKVYMHGLDHSWEPVKREVSDVIRFFHVGEPAVRKGGQLVLDAFRAVFGDSKDVHLTMKAYGTNFLRGWKDGQFYNTEGLAYDNVTVINDMLHPGELRHLYESNHCMVYPTYGEGFGLIPLQAMGTAMPVISTYEWAPYAQYITIPLDGRWDRSIWSVHPGAVLYPDYDRLKIALRFMADNIQAALDHAWEVAPHVHEEFDWLRQTEIAWAHIVEKFA